MLYSIFDNMERCTPDEVQRLLPLVPEEHQAIALKFKHTFGQFATVKSILMLKELLVTNGMIPQDDSLHFEYNALTSTSATAPTPSLWLLTAHPSEWMWSGLYHRPNPC